MRLITQYVLADVLNFSLTQKSLVDSQLAIILLTFGEHDRTFLLGCFFYSVKFRLFKPALLADFVVRSSKYRSYELKLESF